MGKGVAMRKLLSFHLTSVDGYYGGPGQVFDWPVVDEEFSQFAKGQLKEADTPRGPCDSRAGRLTRRLSNFRGGSFATGAPGSSCLQCKTIEEAMGPLSSRDARVRAAWQADRGYLLAIAAGMLGRPAEAEDVVQEAFARLAGAAVDDIGDVRGWLVVVTRRLCLDRLGSAEAAARQPPQSYPRPVRTALIRRTG